MLPKLLQNTLSLLLRTILSLGCPMGSPVAVVFWEIFMCKMEEGVVVRTKLIFCKRYVDDTYAERKLLMMSYSRI